jgi:uncharacterized LabA/DUF88 family protein
VENLKSIAVLIDADNTQLGKLEAVLREISARGRIVVKRAYGNWKKDNLKKWEEELKRLAIKAVQQFDYVTGKNATDMVLVIDAVDMLHTGIYDAFVIVAGDSDYTPIAHRLREAALFVIGAGAKSTPEAFRNSCDEFIYLENLISVPEQAAMPKPNGGSGSGVDEIHELLKMACRKYQDKEGYTLLSNAGLYIRKAKRSFDIGAYEYKKLVDLLRAFPDQYDVKSVKAEGRPPIMSYRPRCAGEK